MSNQIIIKLLLKSIKVEYLNSYLLYEPNSALYAFIDTSELQFQISNHRGKIIQNVKFLPVS